MADREFHYAGWSIGSGSAEVVKEVILEATGDKATTDHAMKMILAKVAESKIKEGG